MRDPMRVSVMRGTHWGLLVTIALLHVRGTDAAACATGGISGYELCASSADDFNANAPWMVTGGERIGRCTASINRQTCADYQYPTEDRLFSCTYYPSPGTCSIGSYKAGTSTHGTMTQAQYNSITATPTTLVFNDCAISPCTACTNAVTNSHYTNYGGGPTSNCLWACDTNYYLFSSSCYITNCPFYTYKSAVNVCTPCAAGTFAGTGTVGGCGTCTYMMAGTQGVYTGPGTTATTCPWVCNTGYFKTGATCSECYWLGAGAAYTGPGVSSIYDCPWTCITGYYRASGVYSSGYTTSGGSCLPCTNSIGVGANLISGGGDCGVYTGTGTAANNCPATCNPGAYKSGNTCLPCSIGTYAGGYTDTTCWACTNTPPANGIFTSAGGSNSGCAWGCNAGYTRDGSTCVSTTCVPGAYRSSGVCTSCLSGTYSAGGAATACTTCKECNVNAYKYTPCPAGSATDVVTCSCKPGYWGDGATCGACPTDTYSTATGATSYSCVQCPAGTFNNQTGGSAATWCLSCANGVPLNTYVLTHSGTAGVVINNPTSQAYIRFTAAGTFTVGGTSPVTMDLLLVAGGGGGGGLIGGGGGAGGLVYKTAVQLSPGTYQVTIGAGGAGGGLMDASTVPAYTSSESFPPNRGINGGNTYISIGGSVVYSATGGGGGGSYTSIYSSPTFTPSYGKDGGSGGGGGGGQQHSSWGYGKAIDVPPQGYRGGLPTSSTIAGGGGGAAEPGWINGGSFCSLCARGGIGIAYPFNGTSVYYADGGGGGKNVYRYSAPGGSGNGGSGGCTYFGETCTALRTYAVNGTGAGGGGGGAMNDSFGTPGASGTAFLIVPKNVLTDLAGCTCNTGYYTFGAGCAACTNGNAYGSYAGAGTNATNCPMTCVTGAVATGGTCACATGYYSSSGSACSPCTNKDTHATYTGPGTTSTNCPAACNIGYTGTENTCTLLVCNAGYFSNGVTCVACRTCDAHAAQTTTCPMGSTEDVSVCACNAGYWGDGIACNTCPTGSICAPGATASTPCPSGNYCTPGASSPTACPSGSYCPTTGLSAAPPCPAGSYCPTGTSQLTCPNGKYSDQGAAACSDSTNANAYGTYTGPGTSPTNAPTTCVSGAYKLAGVCTLCPANQCSAGGEVTTCRACNDTDTQCANGQIINIGPVTVSGGTVYDHPSDPAKAYLRFTRDTVGSFTLPISFQITTLLVGGGGGGGSSLGGGGGAGGVRHLDSYGYTAGTYTVTVGTGGVGGTSGSKDGGTGTATTIRTGSSDLVVAYGGGGGGGAWDRAGLSGASGGGAAARIADDPSIDEGGAATQGTRGCSPPVVKVGGGGGGAGTTTCSWGTGGQGMYIDITGTPVSYGDGGGGGVYTLSLEPSFATGGNGNGGSGGYYFYYMSKNVEPTNHNGVDGTGSGGGGGGFNSFGGKGGDGTAIFMASKSTIYGARIVSCNTGYYPLTTSVCGPCTNGNALGVYTGSGTNSADAPFTCIPGAYKLAGVCTLCPNGTYSTGGTVTACTACRTCGTGSYQSALCLPGSTADVAACTCNPGYWGSSDTCTACPAGTYSPAINATSYPCVQCPAGSFSSQTARTNSLACALCPPGWFGPTPGSAAGPT